MRSLTPKLMLAFLVVSLTGIIVASLVASRMISNAFGDFTFAEDQGKVTEVLLNYYELNGESWQGVDHRLRFLGLPPGPREGNNGQNGSNNRNSNNINVDERASNRDNSSSTGRQNNNSDNRNQGGPRSGGPSRRQRRYFAVADSNGMVVLPGINLELGERAPRPMLDNGQPIEVDGEIVGTFLTRRGDFAANPREAQFLANLSRLFWLGGGTAGLVALVLGAFLSSTLTRPLRELTVATQAVAKGELEQEVPVRSQDELGQLAASFNQMSSDLTRSQHLRRQMTADIAHELRTPLSIILGHAEALHDEILPPTPDTFYIILDEAQRLQRLIEDLRTLSLAEAGELPLMRAPSSLNALLEKTIAGYAPQAEQKEINLELSVTPNLPKIELDTDRMAQVFGNLLGNALRYTPKQGQIKLSATQNEQHIQIKVYNSGQGIPAEELPHIFERFYRADKSRKRHDGGSGLGLAIAKSIIEGHDGRIWAESEWGKSVTFVMELPVTSHS